MMRFKSPRPAAFRAAETGKGQAVPANPRPLPAIQGVVESAHAAFGASLQTRASTSSPDLPESRSRLILDSVRSFFRSRAST